MDELSQIDLALVVDTTASMGSFIDAAKRQLVQTVKALSTAQGTDLQVGIVEFRDHPPQDHSFASKVHAMSSDLDKVQKDINGLYPSGGGDGPESVYQGLWDALTQLQWRKHSYKFAVLVGDSPPHAFIKWAAGNGVECNASHAGNGDAWPDGCPSKLDPNKIGVEAEKRGIFIHAIVMGHDAITKASFTAIASRSGGVCYQSADGAKVINAIAETMGKELEQLDFDRKVFTKVKEEMTKGATYEDAVMSTSATLGAAATGRSISRLTKRGITHKSSK